MSSRKKKTPAVKLDENMNQCLGVLSFLQQRPEASPFLAPVDWKFYGLTDYPEIIKTPMDLGTIHAKLESGKYIDPESFASDVRLVWRNAMKYNRSDSDIYQTAEKLSKLFEKRFAKVKKSVVVPPSDPKSRRRKQDSKVVSREDRVKFGQLVRQLTNEELGNVVEKIAKDCPNAVVEDGGEDYYEIEINAISPTCLLALNAFASKCAAANGSSTNKKRKL